MNPLNFPILSALIGSLVAFAIYIIGKLIFEKESLAVFATIIFSFSYLANVYSRLLTGLTFAPILSLLTYYLLYKIVNGAHRKYFLCLAFVLAIATQNEGTSLSLLMLSVVVFVVFRVKVKLGQLLQIVGIILIA